MGSDIFISIAASLGILACLGDFLITFILGSFYPNYSHIEDTMSEIGCKKSPFTRIFTFWWIFWGISFVIFSCGFVLDSFFLESRGISIAGAILIAIFGIGAGVVSGLYPADQKGQEESTSGKIHGISGGLGYLALLILPSVLVTAMGSWMLIISIITQIAGIIFFFLFLRTKKPKFKRSGLWQRLFLFNYYCYIVIIAIMLLIYHTK